MVGARQKLEHSVGLEVKLIDVLIECDTWLSRTGCFGGLRRCDIVHPTEGVDWDEQWHLTIMLHVENK